MTLSIEKLTMLVVTILLLIVIVSAKRNHDTVEAYAAYGALDKSDSALVADFAACLKQQTVVLPLQSVECSRWLATKYGPTADYRIAAVAKTLIF